MMDSSARRCYGVQMPTVEIAEVVEGDPHVVRTLRPNFAYAVG